MSDTPSSSNPNPTETSFQSTEEMVAAANAHEANALAAAQAELATLQAKSSELADQYLRAKAESDNARRRA